MATHKACAAHRRWTERKDWQILRQCCLRGDGIDHAVQGVAALHNLRLEVHGQRIRDIS